MPDQRRLLLVTTSMARGGAERQVVDLATRFRGRGWSVAVLSMTTPIDHLEELSAASVEIVDLRMTRGRPTPAALLRYREFVKRWRPDVIHSHMVHANLLARAGRLLVPSVPVVCTVHSVIEGRRWREIAYRVTDSLADATTAVSRAAVERYVRVGAVPRGRLLFVPNGFDFSRSPVPIDIHASIRGELRARDGFLWLNVARLVPEKGQDLLLRAFADVRRIHPEARLAIAGDGSDRPALEHLIARLDLQDAAILLGERRDVPALLAAADAFVLSSRWEGLPMVLLEAAGQALPIVCTDVGGCREIASPEAGAVLTAVEAASIGAGMLRIMELGTEERRRIGRALNTRARAAFDLDSVIDRWEGIYASVIARRRNGARARSVRGRHS